MEQPRRGGGWSMEVQAWHVLLLLAVQLIGLGIAYGRISEKQEENSRQLLYIQNQRTITKDDFDDWRAQLIGRMDRLENKLDREFLSK